MPGITTHLAQASLSGAALYPFAGGVNATVFGLSIVLIDLDHVIEYVRQTGSPKIWGVFPCCSIIEHNLSRGFYVFNAFHTIEFFLLIALLGLLHPVFFYISAGMIWHCALDIFVLARKNLTDMRALSIIEYIIRSRNPHYIIRFNDLLRRENIPLPADSPQYRRWLKHWRYCKPLC